MTAIEKPTFFFLETQALRQVGSWESPEFVAQDVCEMLGIKKARDAIDQFPEDEKGTKTIQTLGGPQEALTVTEAGFWRLLFRSNKPFAEVVRKWAFNEVFPAIRKTGRYSPQDLQTQQLPAPGSLSLSAFLAERGLALSVSETIHFGNIVAKLAVSHGVMKIRNTSGTIVYPASLLNHVLTEWPQLRGARFTVRKYQQIDGFIESTFEEIRDTTAFLPFAEIQQAMYEAGIANTPRETHYAMRAVFGKRPAWRARWRRQKAGAKRQTGLLGMKLKKENGAPA